MVFILIKIEMKTYMFGVIFLACVRFLCEATISQSIAEPRFLVYRTVSIIQRSCNCPMSFSCSCCQNVIILYTKMGKNLCVNFTYQRNGLNMDVSLSSNTIHSRTVTDYKGFQFCVNVPGCLFSTACINILQLNLFPKSITACLRLDIYSTKQLWQINYNCISISTQLPVMPVTIQITDITVKETPTAPTDAITNAIATRISQTSTVQSTEVIKRTIEIPEMISESTKQMSID